MRLAIRANDVFPLCFPVFDPSQSEAGKALREVLGNTLETANAWHGRQREDTRLEILRAIGAEGAEIREDVLWDAFRLMSALPDDISAPDVVIEEDGEIAFDWQLDPRHVLSVSIGAQGVIGYSALLGTESKYGVEHFEGKVPEVVRSLLSKFAACSRE
jgi:hypothetical protein